MMEMKESNDGAKNLFLPSKMATEENPHVNISQARVRESGSRPESSAELPLWIKERLFDYHGDKIEDIVGAVSALWEQPDTTFETKFKLISLFITTVTAGGGDEWSDECEASKKALEYINTIENNFFLHALIEDFSQDEKKLDHSREERLAMLARSWDTIRFIENGHTYFENSRDIPRVINNLQDLTESEIREITDDWVRDDALWFGFHKMREFDIETGMEDTNLQADVVLESQLNFFSRALGNRHGWGCIDLRDSLEESFVGRASKNFGVFYDKREGKSEYFSLRNISDASLEAESFNVNEARGVAELLAELKQMSEGGKDELLLRVEHWKNFFGSTINTKLDEYFSGDFSQNGSRNRELFDEIFVLVCEKMKEELSKKLVATIPLGEIIAQNTLLLEKDAALPLEELYSSFSSPRMRSFMEEYFGFSYPEMTIAAQLQFLNYVWDKDTVAVEKVKSFVRKGTTQEERVARFGAFLYCEYGVHVGDLLFEIDEKFPHEDAQRIFMEYNLIAQNAKSIGEIISLNSDELADAISEKNLALLGRELYEAFARRAKDVLHTLVEVSRSGKAQALFFGEKEVVVNGNEDAMRGLSLYSQSVAKIESFLNSSNDSSYRFNLINKEEGEPASFQMKAVNNASGNESYLTVQLRSRGTLEPNTNREFDGEARVNFLFSDSPIDLDAKSVSRQEALSIRLDRECKVRGENEELLFNDPTSKDGEVSLDLGSLLDPLGRVVSVGNALSSKLNKEADPKVAQYYHNRESFSRTLGDAEVFAKVVEFATKKLQSRFV